MIKSMRIGRKPAIAAMAALALAGMLALAACSSAPKGTENGSMDGNANSASMDGTSGGAPSDAYRTITASEAQSMMENQDVIIVDGHVPGAINIPVESIGSEKPSELDDVDAELIVYCRTGVRSKQASDKLIGLGYRHVNDMGGIVDWTGDTVSGDQPN